MLSYETDEYFITSYILHLTYPILTEYGVEYDDILSVIYDNRDDIENYISMDGKTWNTYIDPDRGDSTLHRGKIINLNKGETVYFKATLGDVEGNPNLNGFLYNEGMKEQYFVMEGSIKADGNIQFLLENSGTKMDVPVYCYNRMFKGCTALTQAPALPATTLASGCYSSMFYYCTKVTELHYPASIQNDSTFTGMPGSPWFGATNATVHYDL